MPENIRESAAGMRISLVTARRVEMPENTREAQMGMRISSSSEALEMHNSLQIRSGSANLECQQGAWNAENY